MKQPRPDRGGPDALSSHVADCAECRERAMPVEHVASALRSSEIPIDPAALSARLLARVRPQLERRAAAATRRRLAAAVVLSLLPLPAVLAYDAYVLRLVWGLASSLLPSLFATYLVASYAATVLLLFGLTYAAIPVLVLRGPGQRLAAG